MILAFSGQSLLAKERVTVLADSIQHSRDGNTLVAKGNVEVFYEDYFLQAKQIRYADGYITAEGPIFLTDDTGTVTVAEFAKINETLRTAILTGIKTLLENRVQIAASTFETSGERYVLIQNALVTTCRICDAERSPIWHFRARSVVHDREKQNIYMRDVDFVFGNLHLFSLPELKIPDPTVKRRSGFLPPILSFLSNQGGFLGIPYYHTLGDSADFTVTTYLNNNSFSRFELEYRRVFRRGSIKFDGAVAGNNKNSSNPRFFIALEGNLDIGKGIKLSFSGTKLSDDTFLKDFEYSDPKRITNQVSATKRTEQSYLEFSSSQIVRLKNHEVNKTVPKQVHRAFYRTYMKPHTLGGTVGFELEALWLGRQIGDESSPRKVSRLSSSIDWTRHWLSEGGLQISYVAALSADRYRLNQEALAFDNNIIRISGLTSLDVSMPFVRNQDKTQDLVEPFIQLVWSPYSQDNLPPNQDSRIVDFDADSVRSLDRLVGQDRDESGFRINTGLKYTRSVEKQYDLEMVLGKVFRGADEGQFSENSGLAGKTSDFAASASIQLKNGVGLKHNLVSDEKFDILQSISYLSYNSKRLGFGLQHSMIKQDQGKGMTGDSHSVLADVNVSLRNGWDLKSDVNLDLNKEAKSNFGLGLEYNKECINFSANFIRRLRSMEVKNANYGFSFAFSLDSVTGSNSQSATSCSGS